MLFGHPFVTKEVERYLRVFEQHSDLCIRYGVYQTISDTVQEYSDERAADSLHYSLSFNKILFS